MELKTISDPSEIENEARLADAERAGVESVPALVLEGHAYHINFGADIAALR